MTIAVIIPVLNEARRIGRTLAHTVALGFDEVIVVDGGSFDQTWSLVESSTQALPAASPASPAPSCPIRLLSAPQGRARQLNAGAAASQCDVLLFLHADTLLPLKAQQAVSEALIDDAYVGGRFNIRFDADRCVARLIGCLMNWRSRVSGIATGDQAIFVRREIFDQIGGFTDIPLMEDIDFTRRLKRAGGLVPVTDYVVTAFRRWEQNGPLRTILLMWTLRFLYWIGVSPHRLQHFYRIVR
jgi:rSAM/selenodomain-associated transferase 2